jgi:hypothetical protein
MDPLPTREQLADQAWDDYNRALGTKILVYTLDAYRGDDHLTITLDPPLAARVEPTQEGDVVRWLDSWLDPYWNVLPLEQRPELAGTTSWWVYGPSYNATTGEREPGSFEQETVASADKLKQE